MQLFEVQLAGGQIGKPLSLDPSPHRMGRGKRFLVTLTQGGARSSLALGYNQVTPTEFQFGSLRSHEDERTGSGRPGR